MDRSSAGEAAPNGNQLVAVLPFVAFALLSVAMVFLWAPDPRWAFVIVLPFTFMIALTWLAFEEGP